MQNGRKEPSHSRHVSMDFENGNITENCPMKEISWTDKGSADVVPGQEQAYKIKNIVI